MRDKVLAIEQSRRIGTNNKEEKSRPVKAILQTEIDRVYSGNNTGGIAVLRLAV